MSSPNPRRPRKEAKPKRDPNLPTKAQQRVIDYLRRNRETIFEDRHDGLRTFRYGGGVIVDSGLVCRMHTKGLLRVVSVDLIGDPQQWGLA